MRFRNIYGVDFSGAKLAGRNIWISRAVPARGGRLRLVELLNLERVAGTAEREPALAHLVNMIRGSESALWGMDFPFGLPIEVVDAGCSWRDQIDWVHGWTEPAYALGVECLNRAKKLGGANHIRRTTDTLAKTPFDCYHYRIIYQTFHGMRDVLRPLLRDRGTAIAPFHAKRLTTARRVVAESCPGSTLRRLKLPHNNYKQPEGGPLTAKRRRTRKAMFAGIEQLIDIPPALKRLSQRNPGGDALDAIIAAVGVYQAWKTTDHDHVARHERYKREGYLYI